mmetsp:Transcript_10509/g.29899  ORF Transcript_10509/g.29899 Transcript_10509/m.29899 type:complete len:257 (+) Transcript_10509:69-839(+)|eukprot:CAMPEP_0117660706 /NCGR_PEP_ID=MMETSP0804-20121206/7107_1 /TAXON_ID=1074897 /ORGANISM="Tetraselmis astigmatica, Strain CCMP880" /LENGTH=256 /DNA_ID=CAMNT_0005467445 /DNA_START=51 /DNA_END=824 /DNA_ORIENTATION=-
MVKKKAPGSTFDGDGNPRKRFYRARAHSNPLNDQYFPVPTRPQEYDWSLHFPKAFAKYEASGEEGEEPLVRIADVGCGFGGLLLGLSPLFPDKLIVGMELRDKVSEYVRERIDNLRTKGDDYHNISCLRTNAQKFLPNYFRKGQLHKLFFLFPDPHFKAQNHRRRIISHQQLTEYAYLLEVGGVIYTITDVEELGTWMGSHLSGHPLFEPLSEEELAADPCADLINLATEEGQKVERNNGKTYRNVYRRIAGPHEN